MFFSRFNDIFYSICDLMVLCYLMPLTIMLLSGFDGKLVSVCPPSLDRNLVLVGEVAQINPINFRKKTQCTTIKYLK